MQSPTFVIEGDLLTFNVGGGKSTQTAEVQLIVDDKVARRSTACNSEWMGQRVWNVGEYRGKLAKLVVADSSTATWGHLVVDDIVEWKSGQ